MHTLGMLCCAVLQTFEPFVEVNPKLFQGLCHVCTEILYLYELCCVVFHYITGIQMALSSLFTALISGIPVIANRSSKQSSLCLGCFALHFVLRIKPHASQTVQTITWCVFVLGSQWGFSKWHLSFSDVAATIFKCNCKAPINTLFVESSGCRGFKEVQKNCCVVLQGKPYKLCANKVEARLLRVYLLKCLWLPA